MTSPAWAKRRAWVALAAGAALLAGCMPQADEVARTDAAAGQALYQDYCAVCHGPSGRGDGPAAAGLSPRPDDLTRLSATAGGTFPLVRVMSKIDGYTRTDAGEPMPEFGPLLDGPLVPVETGDGVLTPTPAPLYALARYLMSIQR